MDKCGICQKPAAQLFETGNDVMYACYKCQPLVPEVTLDDNGSDTQNTVEESSCSDSLVCNMCNKNFDTNMQLQNHMRNHRAERRFICTYCNKGFSQSNNLRAHLRIHTNERPYKCSECGKAFTQVTNLNNHVRLHTGERPFACPEPGCKMAYAQVTNLNQHRKRHLSGRPLESAYQCSDCGEVFQQRNHMYNHRRIAHGEQQKSESRFTCQLCELSVGSERALRAHQAEHQAEHIDKKPQHDKSGEFPCVFSLCAKRFSSPREHTEHLLHAHQLRVLSARAGPAPKRGRPPKPPRPGRSKMSPTPSEPKDPLAIEPHEVPIVDEVTITKGQARFIPKLRVPSLFN